MDKQKNLLVSFFTNKLQLPLFSGSVNYLKSLANRKQVQKWKYFEIHLHLLIWNSDIIDKRPSLDK